MLKKLYITFVFLMYVLVGIFFSMILVDDHLANILADAFIVDAFLLLALMIFLGILSFFKADQCSYRFIRNVKLLLIPFYIFFFVIGILSSIGLLVPFLALVILLAIILSVAFGYLSIIVTGLPNIVKLVKRIINNNEINIALIISLIMHFFFGLDVIGSVIVCFKEGKNITINDDILGRDN